MEHLYFCFLWTQIPTPRFHNTCFSAGCVRTDSFLRMIDMFASVCQASLVVILGTVDAPTRDQLKDELM